MPIIIDNHPVFDFQEKAYILSIWFEEVEADDDVLVGVLKVFLATQEDERHVFNLEIKYRISNPFIIDDIILAAAGEYALCVAHNTTAFSIPVLRSTYKKSKDLNPDLGLRDRFSDWASQLSEHKEGFIHVVQGALISCIILS
ncbi:MAG: hypothetical protein DRR42_11205 [Gammaproteobacteria bacterium]|nr:MAG: hypothetical protein DRR42_11205 [Gammaproteobacteria bacterium]